MTASATLTAVMSIPVAAIPNLPQVCKALTATYKPMGQEEAVVVELFEIDDKRGVINVPRQYGLILCKRLGLKYEDKTSLGDPIKFPKVPKPRDYQVEPLKQVQEACGDYYDFLFRARTAWGKTCGALIIASRVGASTLVLVDQDNLKEQWVKTLVDLFGFKREDVGLIQGDKCDYQGKAVTIAMVQTLRGKSAGDPLFQAFGLCIVDEVHVIGAPTFSAVLPRINAAYRFGVSATPKRKDGLQKVLDHHLGKVRVWIDDEHAESSVYVAEHDSVYSWFANTSPKIGRFITEVSEDGSRNLLIAEAACHFYETGRDTLVLSDRIEQLRSLMDLCYYLGIPAEEMGLITGMAPAYGYEKDPRPARRPQGYERGAEYTPIALNLISKKVKKSQVDATMTKARIVFATYGKCAKGFDLPRLSAGVDATPRSEAEQVHGRILRKVGAEKPPIWFTICDRNNYRSVYALAGRINGYVKNNAVIYQGDLQEGWTECSATEMQRDAKDRVRELKLCRIETESDGLNTLVTRAQQMQREKLRATTTTMRATVPTNKVVRRRTGRHHASREVY